VRLIFIGDVIVMKIESKRLILRNWEDGDIELLDENELKDAFDRFEVNN